jgi:hypothetical protein
MEDEIERFLKEAASVQLQEQERIVIRQAIVSHIVSNPVSQTDQARQAIMMNQQKKPTKGFGRIFSLDRKERTHARNRIADYIQRYQSTGVMDPPQRASLLALFLHGILPRTILMTAVFLMFGAGVSFASQYALPGDIFYSFKTDVYEPARGALTFADDEKARWNMRRALTRLEEAEQLAARSSLTPDTARELSSAFETHIRETQRDIGRMRDGGNEANAADLTNDIVAYVQAHKTVISAFMRNQNDSSIEAVFNNVRRVHSGITAESSEAIAGESGDTAKLHDTASRKVSTAIRAVSDAQLSIDQSDPTADAANVRLKVAEAALSKAHEQFDAGSYEESVTTAREAIKASEEARLLKNLPKAKADEAPSEGQRTSVQSNNEHEASVEGKIDVSAAAINNKEEDTFRIKVKKMESEL